MKELWKKIELSNYEVSNLGKVRNSNTGKILKGRNTQSGYEQVSIKFLNEEKFKNQYVHRLVAQSWLDNPLNKKEVNHIDGNKSNNIFTNLEWVTPSENSLHRVHDLLITPKGKRIG